MNQYDYLFKFIIIGNTSVGKSCILSQFTENRFKKEHDATIGVEFGSKNIDVDGNTIKIQIWDTIEYYFVLQKAGQESFRSITRSYFRGSVAAILVYDITKEDSFQDLSKWISDVSENANKDLSVIVLGNKTDLDNREVKQKEGEAFASERGFLFYETSALNGDNINEAFYALAKNVLDRIVDKQIDLTDQSSGVKIGAKRGKQNNFIQNQANYQNTNPQKQNVDFGNAETFLQDNQNNTNAKRCNC